VDAHREQRWVVRLVEEQFHRDQEGRPLREGRTPPPHQRAGEIELRPCPYPGSRQRAQRPMNVSALRQTTAHWDELTGALGVLRTAYAELRSGYPPEVMDVWRVSQLGCALPWLFILAGEPLPAYAAALSKAALGTGILSQRLMQKMLTEQWVPPALTASALLALAESTGTLVGETEVCSAPDKLIARFLDALVAGTPRPGLPAIDALIARRDRVVGFGATYGAWKLALWLYYQARRFLYADLAAVRDSAELRGLLEAACEPPDFFVIEPPHPAAVPVALRAAWLGQLAALIVPFAPDGGDRAVRACAERMAEAVRDDTRDPIARAVATFHRLDGVFGELVAAVEAGLRGGLPGDPVDAATRDRLIGRAPRAMFATLG
jgi:hypothetical protein